MSILEKLPTSFWEESQSIYKQFRKGSITLDDCYEKTRDLSLGCIEKIKPSEDEINQKKKERAMKLLARLMDRAEGNVRTPKQEIKKEESKESGSNKDESINKSKNEPKMEPKTPKKNNKTEPKTPAKLEPKTPGKTTKEFFTCEECAKIGENFRTNLLNLFEQHIILNHQNYKPFKCTKCGYNTHKKQNLNKHIRHNHKD